MHAYRSLLIVTLVAAAQAQTFRGALSGTVTDASGAALPEAAVKLESTSTGLNRATTSTGNGDFFFADLPLGMYLLTVSHPGFESKKVANVEIAVSKTTNINVELGVARQQQTVEVSAAAVNLDTTSSDLAAVVNTREVQDWPIPGPYNTSTRRLLLYRPRALTGIWAAMRSSGPESARWTSRFSSGRQSRKGSCRNSA